MRRHGKNPYKSVTYDTMTPMTPFYNMSIKRGRNGERVKTPAYMEKLVIVSLGVTQPTCVAKIARPE